MLAISLAEVGAVHVAATRPVGGASGEMEIMRCRGGIWGLWSLLLLGGSYASRGWQVSGNV